MYGDRQQNPDLDLLTAKSSRHFLPLHSNW